MGKLFVVATPIGNLSDISQRALDTLSSVKLIAAEDTRRTIKLLNYFEIKTPVISNYQYNELARGEELVKKIMNDGIDIAVVSDAGTPCISDPGSAVVRIARENGVEVIAIPGPSAVISALSVSGFYFDSFGFMGFIPRDNKNKEKYFETIINSPINTFVMFESPNRIITAVKSINLNLPSCKLFVINDITKFYERSYSGNAGEVLEQIQSAEKTSLGEYTIVLQKEDFAKEKSDLDRLENNDVLHNISIEGLIIDEIIKNNCDMKSAMELVRDKNPKLNKNEVYRASLNLKKVLL